MFIGEKIKKLRKEKGLTQKELAKRLGVTQQMIASYENGVRYPKMETIKKIADALNVDMFELIFDKNGAPAYSLESIPNSDDYRIVKTNFIENKIDTLAAHFDAQEFTPEELDEIMNFVEFVKNKRNNNINQPNAAHECTDIHVTDETKKHDHDIMDDDNF